MENDDRSFDIRLGGEMLVVRTPEKKYNCRFGWNTHRHCNAEYELHVILQGACRVEVEENYAELTCGQAILIAPGQYHHPKTTTETFERFTVNMTVPKGRLYTALKERVPSFRVFPVSAELEQLCRSIVAEAAEEHADRAEMLKAMLTQLMLYTRRALSFSEGPVGKRSAVREISRIDLIDNYFENHFNEQAGRAVLAQQLNMSERQLHRVMMDTYGMGFQQKLTNTRMDHAAWLLRSTDKQVGDIAGAVGYASEAAFFQVFRSHFDRTPRQYRSQFKNCDHC